MCIRDSLYSDGDMKILSNNCSRANGINSSGQVVGYNIDSSSREAYAFLYFRGKMSNLGTLGGTSSYAMAINNSGQIAGFSLVTGDSEENAFLYSNGKMTDLGTLGGKRSH